MSARVDTYRQRAEPTGKCKVCGHDRAEHTYAWPIGCHVGTCNCPHVFVAPRTNTCQSLEEFIARVGDAIDAKRGR